MNYRPEDSTSIVRIVSRYPFMKTVPPERVFALIEPQQVSHIQVWMKGEDQFQRELHCVRAVTKHFGQCRISQYFHSAKKLRRKN